MTDNGGVVEEYFLFEFQVYRVDFAAVRFREFRESKCMQRQVIGIELQIYLARSLFDLLSVSLTRSPNQIPTPHHLPFPCFSPLTIPALCRRRSDVLKMLYGVCVCSAFDVISL